MGDAAAAEYMNEKWKAVCSELVLGTDNPEELTHEELESALQGLNRVVDHDEKAFQSHQVRTRSRHEEEAFLNPIALAG
jgi:hypothetical protein